MLDGAAIDELFDTLARYLRIRDKAVHTTFRTGDGEIETAAYKGLFHLARQSMRSSELAEALHADPSTVARRYSCSPSPGWNGCRRCGPCDGPL